ncbi:MAG: hypothetical protein C5B57_07595 [Blastocatellia bacterium]|nr:MAG: hypothetical protein C5B57_07595 [Blastocatellia bacterium]
MGRSASTQVTPLAYTIAQTSKASAFSENYIRRLISRRLLPSVRSGRSIRVLVSDLEEFLRQHRSDRAVSHPDGRQ